jgi:DNA-directed RNA polymerase specialized sigma24 family protein
MAPVQVLDRLQAVDWEALYPRLLAYALSKAQGLRLVKGGGPLPDGNTPDDLVQEAIKRVSEGKRAWDPEKAPDLEGYLKGVIDSLTSAAVLAAGHRRRVSVPSEEIGASADEPDSLDDLIGSECAEAFKRIFAEATADDPRLETVRMGIEDGVDRGEIAEVLGSTVDEVYELTRKLTRRLRKAMREHPCWEDQRTTNGRKR